MWKAAFAGAVAIIAVGIMPVKAQMISEAHISQAKAVLNLKPEQEKHWPRVAAALRAAGRPTRVASADAGFVQRVRDEGADWAARARAAQRVLSAAMPLIRTLDSEQKATARSMVRALGYGHLASRL